MTTLPKEAIGNFQIQVESESDKPITPARLGVTVMTGIFRKRILFLSLLEFGYLVPVRE